MSDSDDEHGAERAYTTQPVLDGSPIVWVCHDEDDDWQFFAEEPVSEDEGRVVHLRHLLELDPSLHEVMSMPMGRAASRSDRQQPWSIGVDSTEGG